MVNSTRDRYISITRQGDHRETRWEEVAWWEVLTGGPEGPGAPFSPWRIQNNIYISSITVKKLYSRDYCYTIMQEIKTSFKHDTLNSLGFDLIFLSRSPNTEDETNKVCVSVSKCEWMLSQCWLLAPFRVGSSSFGERYDDVNGRNSRPRWRD